MAGCPNASVPINATITSLDNDTVEYVCNQNYLYLSGDLTMECVNGTWNGNPPFCVRKCASRSFIEYFPLKCLEPQ